MQDKFVNRMKDAHAYDSWRNRNTLEENLLVRKFLLSGAEIPGWHSPRIKRIEAAQYPVVSKSIWQPRGGGPRGFAATAAAASGDLSARADEPALNVSVFECASRAAAHEYLLLLLAQFHLPFVANVERSEVGDVTFAGPNENIVLFARANVVHVVANVGREPIPVTEFASHLDLNLVSKPEAATPAPGASPMGFAATSAAPLSCNVGETITLLADAPHDYGLAAASLAGAGRSMVAAAVDEAARPADQSRWYKVFSPLTDEIYQEPGGVVYRPETAGPKGVTIFTINQGGAATRQDVELDVVGEPAEA